MRALTRIICVRARPWRRCRAPRRCDAARIGQVEAFAVEALLVRDVVERVATKSTGTMLTCRLRCRWWAPTAEDLAHALEQLEV
jgi:hypothetical protein